MTKVEPLHVGGRFWFAARGPGAVGRGRVELLERIATAGSISQAARDMGMSYKAAWDAVAAMNNLAEEPLVERRAGGRHGGGTRLTARGLRLVEVYRAAEGEFDAFLRRLGDGIADFDHFHALIRRLGMNTSARNQMTGRVKAVHKGAVNSEVVLDIGDGTELVAVITNASVAALGLKKGVAAWALVKASWVILAPAKPAVRTSARNRLCGVVERVTHGAVNSEVVLALPGGKRLTAVVTNESVETLGLESGVEACALVKASQVIVAADA